MIEIPLPNGVVALIDDEDAGLLNFKWHALLRSDGVGYYVLRNLPKSEHPRGSAYLHRDVLGATPVQRVDHRDGNGLNCRRSNLRIATVAQNGMNMRLPKHNTSGYKGVRKRGIRWQAYIKLDQRQLCLGRFDSAVEAAIAYNIRASELFGEFALLNPLPTRKA